MSQQVHLRNAPVTEALLDIRVRFSEDLELPRLLSLAPQVSARYPTRRDRHQITGRFEVKEGHPTSAATETIDGYMFFSADEKQVFQARKDGFTLNRLKPYENWESFRDEAKRLWDLYRRLSSPEILRIGLRYINKIDIPMPVHDLIDYLPAAPVIPKGLPQNVNSFLTRVVLSEPTLQASAVITQLFEQIVDPNFLPLMLDIDVFMDRGLIEEDEAWKVFEQLRELKNAIFFSSITEKTKELFL